MTRPALATSLLIGLSVLGCDSAPDTPATGETGESSDIEVVKNPDFPADQEPGSLVFPPVLALGSEVEGPELFGAMGWVRLDQMQRLWISDRMAQELRAFEFPSGAHLMTLGGPGEGPEEYRAIRPLGFDGRGSVYVHDDALRRLTVYSPEGVIQDQVTLLPEEEYSPRPFHVTGDGILLGQIPRPFITEARDGDLLQDSTRIWSIDPRAGSSKRIASLRGPLFFFHSGQSMQVPFRTGARFGFHDDRAYITDPDGEPSFLVFGPQGLERRIHVARERPSLSSRDTERYLEYLAVQGWSEEALRRYDRFLLDMPLPDRIPTWEYPLVDDEGGVWLLRVPTDDSSETTWDVFDPGGRLLGAISVPAVVQLHQITAGYAVGVHRDELGREQAVVFEVRLPTK
jgi:hypothetical protein